MMVMTIMIINFNDDRDDDFNYNDEFGDNNDIFKITTVVRTSISSVMMMVIMTISNDSCNDGLSWIVKVIVMMMSDNHYDDDDDDSDSDDVYVQ